MNCCCRRGGNLTIRDGRTRCLIVTQIHYLFFPREMRKRFVSHCFTLPIKFKYPSPPRLCVINRIILCKAIPRSIIKDGLLVTDMCVYISLSINQNATVLSPTRALGANYIVISMIFNYIRNKKNLDAHGKKYRNPRRIRW